MQGKGHLRFRWNSTCLTIFPCVWIFRMLLSCLPKLPDPVCTWLLFCFGMQKCITVKVHTCQAIVQTCKKLRIKEARSFP
ncbi:hypothetical protein GOP47_0005873 [Adiantum capillus-veneris]|uniref:Uncharacterized protein n=1 Tax=Adiantum capillus-veneris TaxID=13818 RepID=A0A9D4ZLH9_ADICA|nr:hypothetical protein GOP47_0005873 [Adiantum capillus-veneris]